MVQIINPYGKGGGLGASLGESLSGLGEAFFGPKAATSAYTREKFREQQRQNEATLALPDAIIRGNQDDIVRQGIYAGLAPTIPYGYQQGRGVSQPGVDLATPQGQAAVSKLMMAVPGTAFSSTPQGYEANLQKSYDIASMQSNRAAASAAATADNTPISVRAPTPEDPNRTIITSRANAIKNNLMPVLSAAEAEGTIRLGGFPSGYTGFNQPQMQAAGVATKDTSPQNWVQLGPDDRIIARGRTYGNNIDADTKQPLPPGALLVSPLTPAGIGGFTSGAALGKVEQKDRREAINNADAVLNLGTKINEIVTRNPTAVGAVGNLRLMGQEGADLLNSLNMQFGGGQPGGYDAAVARTRNELRQKLGAGAAQLIPELFDSDLNSVRTMNGMLVYKAAAALGQSGRDASDKDIAIVRNLTGDPAAWFQGPNTYRDKINTLMKIIGQQRDDDFRMLQPGATIQPRTGAAPTAPAAPGGGTTSSGVSWTVGP